MSLLGWAGRDVGGYVLKSLLAVGGLSVIYRACHKHRPAQTVAVKLLSPHYCGNYAKRLFQQERNALLRLKHPRVVRLQDSGWLDEGGYLVLEYVNNAHSLSNYAWQHPSHLQDLVEFVLMVADAMAYVHAQGVVHNDLKADNILIIPSGRVKIIDFGISCVQKTAPADCQKKPLMAGAAYTPFIAAPEQIRGETLTAQVDIFLLGATLLHVLSGKKPLPSFTPESYSPANDERYVKELLAESGLDSALSRILRRALRTSRRHRYSSMRDFAADLREWLQAHEAR